MILYHEMFKQVQFQLGAARITSFTYQSFQQTNRVGRKKPSEIEHNIERTAISTTPPPPPLRPAKITQETMSRRNRLMKRG